MRLRLLFFESRFFKHCHCTGNKIWHLKISCYDKFYKIPDRPPTSQEQREINPDEKVPGFHCSAWSTQPGPATGDVCLELGLRKGVPVLGGEARNSKALILFR